MKFLPYNNDKLCKLEIWNDGLFGYRNLYLLICSIMPSSKIFIGMDRFYGIEQLDLSFEELMNKIFPNNETTYFPISIPISFSKKLDGLLFGTHIYPNQISIENFNFLLRAFCETTIILCHNSIEEIINCYTQHNLNKIINSNLSLVYVATIHENCITLYYNKDDILEKDILSYFDI